MYFFCKKVQSRVHATFFCDGDDTLAFVNADDEDRARTILV